MERTLKPYCFLASYDYYRGAAVKFSLAEIVKEAEVEGWAISCIFQDGRAEIEFDNAELSCPSLTRDDAAARMREIGRRNSAIRPGDVMLGPPPSEETVARWRRWSVGDIPESDLVKFVESVDRRWLSDEELDRIEREACAGVPA